MKIEGKFIASQIKVNLKKQVFNLKNKNIIPHLAVILIGNDPSSHTYVRQKQKVGEDIGIKITLAYKQQTITKEELYETVNTFNKDKNIHGIIIQRPVASDITKEELDLMVDPYKDVDGFHPNSKFTPPIACAVIKILEWIFKNAKLTSEEGSPSSHGRNFSEMEEFNKDFINWLKKQEILVIGRGETAGKPIVEVLQKMRIKPEIAHSKTTNLKELCLRSDIIITCVGKSNVVRHQMLSKKTILIGVGLHQEYGKLQTDYNQEEISQKIVYYTPVPGGVGPVNVACLFENLLQAVKLSI